MIGLAQARRALLATGMIATSLALAPPPASAEDELGVVIAPYALLASLDGDVGLGRAGSTPVSADFGEILEALDLAAMLRAELWYGDWGLIGDLAYMKLKDDLTGPRDGVLDASIEQYVWEALLGRRFGVGPGWVDAFAGVRIWDLDVDLDAQLPNASAALDRSVTWVDPVLGARGLYPVWGDLFATLRFDIGGFGAGSDFSWRAGGGLGYAFTDLFALSLQYVALDVDYETGSEGRAGYFLYDTTTHGPLFGFVFRF